MSMKRRVVLLVGAGALVLITIYLITMPDATVVAAAILFIGAVLAAWASGRSGQ